MPSGSCPKWGEGTTQALASAWLSQGYSFTVVFGQSLNSGRLGILIVERGIPLTLVLHYKVALYGRTMKSLLKFTSSLDTAASSAVLPEDATATANKDTKKSSFESPFLIILFAKTFKASSSGQVGTTLGCGGFFGSCSW